MGFNACEQTAATSTVRTADVLSIPANAQRVFIQASGGPVRYTLDGVTDPSQSSGVVLVAGRNPKGITPDKARRIRWCRGSGSDSVLVLSYRGVEAAPTYPPDEESASSRSSVSTSSSSLSSSSRSSLSSQSSSSPSSLSSLSSSSSSQSTSTSSLSSDEASSQSSSLSSSSSSVSTSSSSQSASTSSSSQSNSTSSSSRSSSSPSSLSSSSQSRSTSSSSPSSQSLSQSSQSNSSSSSESVSTSSSSRSSLSVSSESSSLSSSGASGDTLAGILHKTPDSYLARQAADVSGLATYGSESWSVEVGIDLEAESFFGDIGDIMRHGVVESGFNSNRVGWSIHSGSQGYSSSGAMTITFSMCDGSGHSIEITSSTKTTGRAHVVGTFDNGTKTASLYINGALKSSSTNASFAWTSSPGGALAIGSNNKNDAADTPSVGGKAMPEFKMHLGRLWRGALTASDVSELYRHWHPSGHTGIPYSVTGTALSAWYMNSEVGDKSGSVGSGWLADAIGTNHLHILNTGAGSGDTSYIFAPSGSVRGTSPTSGATGVSGAVALEADGVTGDGLVMQYYFEVDEANTFDTAALRSSGWLVTKNYWRPRLKPSTTYYWRVKVKDANGTESSWSSTYYLTTRAATEWFVRPRTYVAGTYGSEDGTSYENAWNGFRFNGYKGEQQLTLYEAQAKLNIYAAPGDTVWACGDFGLLSTSSFSSITSTSPYSEYVHAVGMDDDYPVYLRLDHPSHPGRMFKGFSFTGSHNWRNDGGNVYSTATYYAGLSSSSRLTVMQDGVPNCDFDNPLSNSTIGYDSGMTLASPGFYVDSGRMYVRMPDNDVPDNNLWYFLGSTETFLLYLNQCQYLHIMGGDWGCCSPLSGTGGEESTHIKIYGGRYKFNLSSWGPFQISDFVDYWTIENNEISYVPNGVYGTDTGSGDVSRTGDYIVVRNNWFHDIGTAAGWTDSDGHCVGVQTGTGWTIEDNLGERCGTAIEIWGGDFKHSRDHLIQRNVVRDIEARSVTFGAGIAITGGTSKLGIRDGIRILNNVIYNADGSGIHISIADPVEVVGNLIMNVGYGPNSYTDHGILLLCSASVSSRGWWNNNVVIGPTSEFLRIVGNGVTSEYMKIDHNKYWKESPTTASSSNQFRAYISPYDYSFNGWQAGTPWDQNSTWGDPASTALPPDFDDVLVDMFVGTVGDVDGDGGVDADDRALLLANGSQYLAVQRVMENLLAE